MFRRCLGIFGGVEGVFICQKRLRLSCTVDECKPLEGGSSGAEGGRGLHSSTFQLNLSRF